LLQTAARLFATAPARPEGVFKDVNHFPWLWVALLSLLSMACSARHIVQHALGRSTSPDVLRRQMARQLLQALPRLPVALRVAAEHAQLTADSGAEVACRTLSFTGRIANGFHLLASSGPQALADRHLTAETAPVSSIVGSLADVPACCAAACALMQVLPHVAALQALAGAVVDRRDQLGMKLVLPISGIAAAVRYYCQGMGSGGPWSAAEATAATEALWQLHTTLCRAVHGGTAGLTVAQPHSELLLTSLAAGLDAALAAQAALQGRAANNNADVADGKPRQADSSDSRVFPGCRLTTLTCALSFAFLHMHLSSSQVWSCCLSGLALAGTCWP
jgi:hypothetical protein